jgi:hypothetical protein
VLAKLGVRSRREATAAIQALERSA